MKIGYIRISTIEQNEGRQIKIMEDWGIDQSNIYIDKQSGKNTNRPELKRMMDFVRSGDTVYCESISRIARNTKDFLSIISILENKGVSFISQKEQIDTTTPQGKFMLTVFSALAELERENLLQRQQEGIAIAKEKGVYKGRKPIQIDEKQFQTEIDKWQKGEQTARATMKKLGLKPNTFYDRVKRMVKQLQKSDEYQRKYKYNTVFALSYNKFNMALFDCHFRLSIVVNVLQRFDTDMAVFSFILLSMPRPPHWKIA